MAFHCQRKKFNPPPPLPYVQLTTDQERQMLDAAKSLADKALESSKCAKLFNKNGKGIDPTTLLDDLIAGGQYGSISYGRIRDAATAAIATPIAPVGITLNDNANGLWGKEGTLFNAGTLLHELGHAYTDLWGVDASDIKPDSRKVDPKFPKISNDNDSRVWTDCLKDLQP